MLTVNNIKHAQCASRVRNYFKSVWDGV